MSLNKVDFDALIEDICRPKYDGNWLCRPEFVDKTGCEAVLFINYLPLRVTDPDTDLDSDDYGPYILFRHNKQKAKQENGEEYTYHDYNETCRCVDFNALNVSRQTFHRLNNHAVKVSRHLAREESRPEVYEKLHYQAIWFDVLFKAVWPLGRPAKSTRYLGFEPESPNYIHASKRIFLELWQSAQSAKETKTTTDTSYKFKTQHSGLVKTLKSPQVAAAINEDNVFVIQLAKQLI